MATFGTLLILLSLLGFVVCIVLLIRALIKKEDRKKWTLGLLICFVLVIVSAIMISAGGSSNGTSASPGSASASASISDASISSASTSAEPAEEDPEPNTSAMVDSIARQAKADAENASDTDLKKAYGYIKANYKNCFGDNETMEQMMYNGWLLEYAYDENESMRGYYNLGMDAEQLVKYVYRGAETKDDQSTKENIKQIEESIQKIEPKTEKKETKKQTKTTPAETKQPEQTPVETPQEAQDTEERVWIPTNGGSKYHSNPGCSKMKNPQEVTISQAKSRGFTACKRCY